MTEVHWRIVADLGFKFRSHFTTLLLAVLLAGGSSRAMLASARSLVYIVRGFCGVSRSTTSINGSNSHGKAENQLQHRDVSGHQQRPHQQQQQQEQEQELTADASIVTRLRFPTSISIFTARRVTKYQL